MQIFYLIFFNKIMNKKPIFKLKIFEFFFLKFLLTNAFISDFYIKNQRF